MKRKAVRPNIRVERYFGAGVSRVYEDGGVLDDGSCV